MSDVMSPNGTSAASAAIQSLDDARESRRLVYQYSLGLEERLSTESETTAQILSQALSQSHCNLYGVTNPWRKFYEPLAVEGTNSDPITQTISVESKRVCEKWVKFMQACSKDDRLELSSSEPTVQGVIELVERARILHTSKKEESRFGRAMKLFRKFCDSLNSHKTFLELLPEGNQYVSIFTGALSVIVKASINHEKIAESFASALCDISEQVAMCQAELEVFHTKEMMELVADMYSHIFTFLSDVMGYFMEKIYGRLLDSLKEDFYQKFQEQVENIQHKGAIIRENAERNSRIEIRVITQIVERISDDIRVGLVGQDRQRAEMEYHTEQLCRQLSEARHERYLLRKETQPLRELAVNINKLLEVGATSYIVALRTPEAIDLPIALEMPQKIQLQLCTAADSTRQPNHWTLNEVLSNSKHLEDFFDRGCLRLSADDLSPVMVSPETLRRIADWTQAEHSEILWLDGSPELADGFQNPLTVLGDRLVTLAAHSIKVPVISYFCSIPREEDLRSGNDTPEAQATVALVCALIRQLVELLLPVFETEADLSEMRVKRVDGTIASMPDALQFLHDLIDVVDCPIFYVVDGFHRLDDRSTDDILRGLVQELRHKGTKALFASSGRSAALRQELSVTESVTVEVPDTRAGPRRLELEDIWGSEQ